MFMRVSTIQEHNLFFDEKYFMYLEDYDLIHRFHRVGKTIFYPEVTVIHDHAKESYVNNKLLFFHIKSALRHFCKFGWLFDFVRRKMNKQIVKELTE